MRLCSRYYRNAGAQLVQKYGRRALNLHFDKLVLRYEVVGNVKCEVCGEQTLCVETMLVILLNSTGRYYNAALIKSLTITFFTFFYFFFIISYIN